MKLTVLLLFALVCIVCTTSVSARLGEESSSVDTRALAEPIIFSNDSGSVEIADDYVIFTDGATGESLTVKGKVTYDITSKSVIVTGEDQTLRFNEEGFILYSDEAFTIGNTDGYITTTGTSITFTDSKTGESNTFEGKVTMDEETGTYTITNEDGSFSMNQDGFIASGEDGSIFGSFTDDGTGSFTDDQITFSSAKGSVTVTESSVTFTDAETGEVTTIEGAVTYDEENEAYTVTNADGSLSFTKDGFFASGEDGGFFGSFTDDGSGSYTDDSVAFQNKEGSIVVTEDSVTITDAATGEVTTIEGEVEYDEETETYSITNDEGTFAFNEDGFAAFNDEGFIAGGTDGEVVAVGSFTGDEIIVTDKEGKCLSIPDIICLNDDFSILCDVLNATPEQKEFLTNSEYTLFAPSNDAFELISEVLETLDLDTLGNILAFHGTAGTVTSDDLECGQLLDMSNGYPSRTQCKKNDSGDEIVIQKGGGNRKNNLLPEIVVANIVACNGVIHVVDHVMLPNYIDKF